MSDTVDEMPAPLPSEMTSPPEPGIPENDLPLHLRVLRAIVEGEADQARIDQALLLANEVYELETSNIALESYRSAS